ncbi:MAG: hypothetical protein V4724_24035 [Pseudomonadota bacterium]
MDVDDTIVAIAGAILHEHRLHVLSVRDRDHIFYYAVPSKRVRHARHFQTPLAAAMPGHPQHRGDGVYALQSGSKMIAAIKQGAELFVLHDEACAIDAAAQRHVLPVHMLSDTTEMWPLEPISGRQRALVERIAGKLSRLSAWVLGSSALAYLLLSGGDAYLARQAEQQEKARPTAEIVSQFQYTSPLFEQLAHFQQISATVVRSGGWIEGYIWKPRKGEAFEIVMPGWISHDYIEALGPGTVADYNIPDNLVTARKGNLEEMSKP